MLIECRCDFMIYFVPVHTTLEQFENRGFTLKMHDMFSVHITPEKF